MIRGIFSFFLNLDELSITVHPCSFAFGANSPEIFAPAEKKAISALLKSKVAKSSTINS